MNRKSAWVLGVLLFSACVACLVDSLHAGFWSRRAARLGEQPQQRVTTLPDLELGRRIVLPRSLLRPFAMAGQGTRRTLLAIALCRGCRRPGWRADRGSAQPRFCVYARRRRRVLGVVLPDTPRRRDLLARPRQCLDR